MPEEKAESTQNLVNHFLIAMPQLEGSYFANSVIYLWRHSHEGALGIVVNLPLEMQLSEIFEQLEIQDKRRSNNLDIVLSGGPVETDKGFILHDANQDWASTLEVVDGIKITTSKDILADISEGNGPENFLLALGCAGWSPGQLEQEIASNTWLTSPASKDVIFSKDFKNKANKATAALGFDLNQLSPTANIIN